MDKATTPPPLEGRQMIAKKKIKDLSGLCHPSRASSTGPGPGGEAGQVLFRNTLSLNWLVMFTAEQGRNWVILKGGRRYICNSKDKMIHGLSPGVKCVALLFRGVSLAKV